MINIYDKIVIEKRKKNKINFYTNRHWKYGFWMEFTAC